jgi:hypothetical protein
VPDTGLKVGGCSADDARINSCKLPIGRIDSEKQGVEEGITGAASVCFTILNIPAKIRTGLHIVLAAVEREGIRIAINALVKDLRKG